ncbi:MAG: isochorismatase family protein [Desulfobacterales bacterium]|jgi:nicotinamidase/pyrazinamidase
MTSERFSFQKGDALVIVDVQNDFLPGGALPIDKGDEVIPVINRYVEKARNAGVPVFASRDWHPAGHISFQEQGGKWPPHCLQDTEGAAFSASLSLPDDAVVVTKGVRFDQDQNSAFDQTGLAVRLKQDGVTRLVVAGLAQDVCVLATVIDARREGFEVLLLEEATRPVTAEGGRKALVDMIKAGAKFVDAGLDVCVRAPEWAEHQRPGEPEDACDDGRSGNI